MPLLEEAQRDVEQIRDTLKESHVAYDNLAVADSLVALERLLEALRVERVRAERLEGALQQIRGIVEGWTAPVTSDYGERHRQMRRIAAAIDRAKGG